MTQIIYLAKSCHFNKYYIKFIKNVAATVKLSALFKLFYIERLYKYFINRL